MTVEMYDMEIREIYHDLGYWIINQTHWYSDNEYTEESAKNAFIKRQKERNEKQNQRREYIIRNIVRETAKAYLVEQEVYNRRDGAHTNYKWVAKSVCKNRRTDPIPYTNLISDTVEVPVWCVGNGVW